MEQASRPGFERRLVLTRGGRETRYEVSDTAAAQQKLASIQADRIHYGGKRIVRPAR